MHQIKVNVMNFPTTVVFVDDDTNFLSVLKRHFNQPLYCYFEDAHQAIQALAKHRANYWADNTSINHEMEEDGHSYDVNIALSHLHQLPNNPKRFSTISVVVVDQSMPQMDGLDFCQAVKDKAVKKIMLTALSDYRLATEAFNKGFIDKFIVKDSPTMLEELQNAISELQAIYFHESSLGLLSLLKQTKACALNSPSFEDLFNSCLLKSQAMEYYLLDSRGSYLFVNAQGKQSWLVLRTEQDIEGYLDTARNNEANKKLLEKLVAKNYMPVLLTEQDYKMPVKQWTKCLAKMSKLAEDSSFYYALVGL